MFMNQQHKASSVNHEMMTRAKLGAKNKKKEGSILGQVSFDVREGIALLLGLHTVNHEIMMRAKLGAKNKKKEGRIHSRTGEFQICRVMKETLLLE